MSYINNNLKEEGCAFCNAVETEDGLDNLILKRERHAYVILNRYPYTSGHLMVIPFEHVASLEDLDEATRIELISLVSRSTQVLRKEYNAEGINLGANIGDAAGAGIPKHFHFHVVPRWKGDTNFMSTLGQTRVVPEALSETYQRVKNCWQAYEADETV